MKTTPSRKLQQLIRDATSQTESVSADTFLRAARRLPAVRFKKILATTDFSRLSLNGVRAAISLGDRLGASTSLVHVVKPAPNFTGTETSLLLRDDLDMLELADKELAGMAKSLSKKNSTVEPLVRFGQPFHEITELARSRGVDLIVTATHGHTGLKRVLLGNTAERVVRQAACPVLTVHAPQRVQKPKSSQRRTRG